MLLDMDTLAIGLSLVFILTIGVVVVVIVLTRAGRQPRGGLMWDEMKSVPATPRPETAHLSSPSGIWPPPSGGLGPPTGRPDGSNAEDARSGDVSNLIPL